MKLTAGGGEDRWASARALHRVDAAAQAGLLGLLDDAVELGWTRGESMVHADTMTCLGQHQPARYFFSRLRSTYCMMPPLR